jgi:hypothetical protein
MAFAPFRVRAFLRDGLNVAGADNEGCAVAEFNRDGVRCLSWCRDAAGLAFESSMGEAVAESFSWHRCFLLSGGVAASLVLRRRVILPYGRDPQLRSDRTSAGAVV